MIYQSKYTLPEGLYLIWIEYAKLDEDIWLQNCIESLHTYQIFNLVNFLPN